MEEQNILENQVKELSIAIETIKNSTNDEQLEHAFTNAMLLSFGIYNKVKALAQLSH